MEASSFASSGDGTPLARSRLTKDWLTAAFIRPYYSQTRELSSDGCILRGAVPRRVSSRERDRDCDPGGAPTSQHPCAKVTPRVLQVLRNDGHVVECGGVPPLWRKTRVSFRSQLRRRSKSGGAPPHSITQAKPCAANDVFCNLLKIWARSSGHPRTKNNATWFENLANHRGKNVGTCRKHVPPI